jgi:eukaryotic-like serine/threonine-protein kinase
VSVLRVGRYVVCDEIASGGMATVHYGRVLGEAGFSRIVAVKRLHETYAKDPDFTAMFMDEARIAARIQHPNVVSTLDVVSSDGVLLLVMEYLHGEALSKLLRFADRDGEPVPLDIASAILCDALHGLHAAHEATNEAGEPLHLVHRDVSPQNLLVGAEGITRVVDFGIAKAVGQVHTTREGQLKGKIAYMAPEQLAAGAVDRRADVYAAGVILWETLSRRSLFAAANEVITLRNVLEREVEPPSAFRSDVTRALDDVVMRALSRTSAARFATARDMAQALEAAVVVASPRRVAEWVETLAGDRLTQRKRRLVELERAPVPPEIVTSPQIATSAAISVPAEPPRSKSRAWIMAVVAVLIVAAGFGARTLAGSDASATTAPAAVSPPSAAPVAPAATPTSGAPEPTRASVEAPPAASATARAEVAPSAAPEAARGKSRRRPETKPSAAASANCAVRSYVDADGITQFRRECR